MELVRNELQFYSKFARPLIFQLPDAKDRVLAAGWVKKIRDEQAGSEKLRTDYIKLLLFALQRRKLVGIFAEEPGGYEILEEFPQEFDLNAMAKNLIKKEQFERIDRIRRQLRGQIGDSPPYLTDCSSDFREYVAAQDIPGFGVHCYYAISKEPIDTWSKADRGIFPKMAKSAVDTSSSLPPGFAGKSADYPCICPPAPGEPDPACKATVHNQEPKKKKKRQKNLGKSPPTHPLGQVPTSSDDREPPSWSSNLMEIRDAAGVAGEIAATKSTGAIPKRKLEKRMKVPVKLDQSDIYEENLKEMESTMKDYQRGKIKAVRLKRHGRPKAEEKDDDEDIEETDVPANEDIVPLDDNFDDIDQSQYQGEIDKDSNLLKYFKGKLDQAGVKQRLAAKKRQASGACPAKSGIPMSTPRPSAVPKRRKSSEKLYQQQENLPRLEAQGKGLPKSRRSGIKDPEVYKLFEETSAMAAHEDEEDKESQQFFAGDEEQPAAMGGANQDSEYEQLREKVKQQERDIFKESPAPIQKGSPEANAILSEAMDALQEGSPLGFSDDWFAEMNTGADGFMQGDIPQSYAIPEDYGGHGLPEVMSVQPQISPYKPYIPERKVTQRTPGMAKPAQQGPLYSESPEGDFRTPSPCGRPISPAYVGSPGQADSLGYTTPEHLKIRQSQIPPTPQRIKPPPLVLKSPNPLRSPCDIRLPIGDEQDAFFFDMAMEQPPVYASPGQSPCRPNIMTVGEAPPRFNRAISDIPMQNIFEAEPLGEADMASILEEAPAVNIFGEDMPIMEEHVDPSGIGHEYFSMTDEYDPTFRRWERKTQPDWKVKDMNDVGYSLAKTIRSTEQRTDTNYKSPKPKKLTVPRTEISEDEQRYIDFLFPEDPDMNRLIKRVSGMIADVDQDFPDPTHLVVESPEMLDYTGQDLFQEASPGLDYYSSPEPCPAAAPPQATGIPLPGRQLPRPSGLKQPRARGIPVPKSAVPQQSGGIPIQSGGIPTRSGGIPQGSGGIPARSGGIPQRSGGIPTRSGGIPQRSGGIPTRSGGIPQRSGGIPQRSGGIPTPAGAASRPDKPGPSRARPAAPRQPIYAKEPLYFPNRQTISGEWPQMSLGFHRDMRDHKIDKNFLDVNRQRMVSRQVLVGPTAGRRHDTRRKFRPTEMIEEHPDEPNLTPRKYGPGPRFPCAAAMPPEEPAVPPSFEDMLASYVSPIYMPPGEGFLEASPPYVDIEEDPQLKGELIYDENRELGPLDMKHLRRMQGSRLQSSDVLLSEIDEFISNSCREPCRTGVSRRQPMRPTLEQPNVAPCTVQSPLEPYTVTPLSQMRQRDGRKRSTRLPPGYRSRRLDFDEVDPDIVTETDKYVQEKLTQHKLAPLSPTERASRSPEQYGILDERIPPDVRLPQPIRAPTVVEGWRTPPWLSRRPKPPPEFQAKLPPVNPNQWFFEGAQEPAFAGSPPGSPGPSHIADYDLGTPQLVLGGGQMGGLFFDEDDGPSPLPDIGASPEWSYEPSPLPNIGASPERTCGSPTSGVSPEAMVDFQLPPSTRTMGTPPHIRTSPSTIETPLCSPCDTGDTPLDIVSGHIVTPSPDAHMKTPVTAARKIFEAAGVRDSPLRFSPLSDPAAMDEMKQRVLEAQGRRGIRTMREEAALPRRVQQPPQHTRTQSGMRKYIQTRWTEEEDFNREPDPISTRSRRRTSMPRIIEAGTPPLPPGAVRTLQAQRPSPGPPPDPHGLPPVLTFDGPQTTSPCQGPEQKISRFTQARRQLDFSTPQQDDFWENDQYIQTVMSRQNLQPLSPQGPVSPMNIPSPSTWDPATPDNYDMGMLQIGEGYDLNSTELSPLPDIGASPELAGQLYPPRIQVTSPSPRLPSHEITMATCGSPRDYMPDSFSEGSPYTPRPVPSHGITMATCGSPRGYMPDSFVEDYVGSPLSPMFTPSPGADFRSPERLMRARDIFHSAGIQEIPERMPTPSPPMQEMISRVKDAPGRSCIGGGNRDTPLRVRQHLRRTWAKANDEDLPKGPVVRRRPGPPSMPTLKEQTPPFDQYGLPAVQRGAYPVRTDPYYSPPPANRTPRSRRDVLPEDPVMQGAINSLREGRPMDLNAIQVAACPAQQPCSPTTPPGYRTPEHLRIRQQSPYTRRVPTHSQVKTPIISQAHSSQRAQEVAYMSPHIQNQEILTEGSPAFEFPQSPQQDRTPEQFEALGTCGAKLFDQQMEALQFDSPPSSRSSPQPQNRFGLPDLVQLPPSRDLTLAPLRPKRPPPARAQQRAMSPCSPPGMENYEPVLPVHETTLESPQYEGLRFSRCRGAMIEPMEEIRLSLPNSPEESPHHWQQLTATSPGRNQQLANVSPGFLQTSPCSPQGSPSPDRVVSHSGSRRRCITARRLDF